MSASATSPATSTVDRPVEAPGVPAEQPASPSARDPWLDNAKYWLIVLVVVGHAVAVDVSRQVPAAHALYLWIYSFHMPAFIFVAGLLGRSRSVEPRHLRSLVTRVVAPYLIFSVVYAGLVAVHDGRPPRVDLVNPQWLLWFLPALLFWRLTTPMVLTLRWPLLVSVTVGLGAGLIDRIGSELTLSRALSLAPFFVAGATAGPWLLPHLRRPAVRWAGGAVLAASLVAALALHDHVRGTPGAFYWDAGYAGQGLPAVQGLLVRAGMYAVGATMLVALLAVVPRRRSWTTAVGAASLYVYLLHGLVVRVFRWGPLDSHVRDVPTLLLLVLASVAVASLLGSKLVRVPLRPLVEPRLTWLLSGADRPGYWSKSSTTSSDTGRDWQASTKPASSSSRSSA